jgi:hypothetical protein
MKIKDVKIQRHGPGIRYFKCYDCDHEWIEISRDRTSPSGEHCKCDAFIGAVECDTATFDRLRQTLRPL